MTFFKLIFLAAVLFYAINVRVAHACGSHGNVPNYVSSNSLCRGGVKFQSPYSHRPDWQGVAFRDVVINEIMADPSPPNKLPEAEFIEILNTSDNIIDLTGWTISDPKSTAILPSLKMAPNQYVILCKNGQQDLFIEFGQVIGLTNWPTLNNSGDELSLKSSDSITIDHVKYTSAWYVDKDKSKGGWSLEQINPFDPCPDSQNWRASANPSGGSPGRENTVFEVIPDLKGPEIVSVLVKNDREVEIWFSEKVDTRTVMAENLDIFPANEIEAIDFGQPFALSINVLFKNPIQPNKLHTLTINNITDCAGNLIPKAKNNFQFALPVEAAAMDLVINEVLFNPRTGGKDFVEIYNASQKYVNLKGWQISNKQSISENPKIASISHDMVIGPDEYLVLTEDANILKADYPFGAHKRYYEVQDMPTLADDRGNVTLTDSIGRIMDEFDYDESFHLSLIKDQNGVSLERISAVNPTNNKDNWHSAASAVGYATPGYENSQRLLITSFIDQISIEPKVFVPNNDGVKDFTSINYQFDNSGYLISIFIYDVRGRRVKEIVNNALAGVKGFYQWNGTNNSNALVHPGYYIVLFDVLDPGGRGFQVKKTVVVATDF